MDTQVKIVLLVAAALLAFIGYCIYHNYRRKQNLMRRIQKTWGKRPDREYSAAEFNAISHYFQRCEKKGFYVDDITWNDLDMDTIFMLLNHTWSSVGESYLYSMLRTPVFDNEVLTERERLVRYFAMNTKEREQMELFFAKIGRTGSYSIFDYVYNLADFKRDSPLVHYLGILALIASVGITAVAPQYGVLAILAALGFCWGTYFSRRKKIEPYVVSCVSIIAMLKMADCMKKVKLPEIDEYVQRIDHARKKFAKFKRNSFFVISGGNMNAGGGLEQSLAMYLNLTFHIDLLQFNTLVKEIRNNIGAFEELVENIGVLESALAVASFRTMMPDYCIPQLGKDESVRLKTENIYHPMIDEPVRNSISVENGVLLTGSNASGKSTFLKTVAINAILGQTINTCLADSFEGNFYKVYSSMALKDDLQSQESYYIVEIKSLKRILDHIGSDEPVLCFVDEVLRGTNTVERIAASSQILKSMARKDVMCFAATHDIELTHILEQDYSNYHFQEEVVDNDILFNYQLYEGRATSRNAIKLLSIIGYDENIIEKAETSAKYFVESGEWNVIDK